MEYRATKDDIKTWASKQNWILLWDIQYEDKKASWELRFFSPDGEEHVFLGENIGCTDTG